MTKNLVWCAFVLWICVASSVWEAVLLSTIEKSMNKTPKFDTKIIMKHNDITTV